MKIKEALDSMSPYDFFRKHTDVTCILVDVNPFGVTLFRKDFGRQPFTIKDFPEGIFRDDFASLIAALQNAMTISRVMSYAYFPDAETASEMLMPKSRKSLLLEEEYVTPADVAKVIGVTPKTVRNMIQAGKIKGVKLGRTWKINTTDIRSLLDAGKRNSLS